MNDSSVIDFCRRAPFSTLRQWHRAKNHVHMLDAMERTYGAREARLWLIGRVLIDEDENTRAFHFQPNTQAKIPQDTD